MSVLLQARSSSISHDTSMALLALHHIDSNGVHQFGTSFTDPPRSHPPPPRLALTFFGAILAPIGRHRSGGPRAAGPEAPAARGAAGREAAMKRRPAAEGEQKASS
eukprot:2050851-Pyramimonas_sp.AAC.1